MRLLFLFLIFLSACSTVQVGEKESQSEAALALTNVTIVNVRDGSLEESKTILIDSGKITKIVDHSQPVPQGIRTIDGKGKYVIPGLAEMHAHIPSPNIGRENIERTLFLYLSNGITTIRGMLGHPIHLELREQAEKNEILSPRIYTSSPSLNGNSVQSVEEARNKVNTYASEGYDFLKLHPGIKKEVFDEIVRVAGENNITFAGHVSVDVGIRHALESGYASIDHVDGYLEGLVPPSDTLDPNSNGFFGYNFTDLADTSGISELVRMSRRYQVWVVPTQSLFDRWFSPEDPEKLASAPEMKYIFKSTLENWVRSKKQLTADENYSPEQWERFNTIRRKLIYKLHHNGYGLVLGSDAPQVFNVPGFSIHHEIDGMIKSGLTPLEALQTGTINCAKFFNEEGNMGEIVVGASADLVLLNKNPLDDISNLREPDGVIVRGTWVSRNDIDAKLKEIAEIAQSQ